MVRIVKVELWVIREELLVIKVRKIRIVRVSGE